jgi:hypothetical protein
MGVEGSEPMKTMSSVTAFQPLDDSRAGYWIDPERGIRVEEYRGQVGLDEIRWVAKAAASDPAWGPDMNGLVDFSGAKLEMSSNDVLRLALMLRREPYRTRGWTAFTVASSVAYGIVRMLGTWSRMTDRIRIFSDREEAERWLHSKTRKREEEGAISAPVPLVCAG